MRKILFVALMLLSTSFVYSQANKSVFFEAGANGFGFSGNFDARFAKKENGFGFRAGIGFFPGIGSDDVISFSTIFTLPAGINYLAGKGPNYFEAGLGGTYFSGSVTLFNESGRGSGFAFVPSAGYRYAKVGGGFQGRFVISPIIGSGGGFFYLGGSVGFTFK